MRAELCCNEQYIESIFVELTQLGTQSILLGCIYRPPNTDVSLFNSTLLNLLQIINKKKYSTIAIAGDFNLDLIKTSNHAPTSKFINNLLTYSYIPTINVPTRITEFSSSLIDNIFVFCKNPNMKAAVIYSDISDHFPILVRIEAKFVKKQHQKVQKTRIYSPDSIEKFNNDLANPELWANVYAITNTNRDTKHCHECLSPYIYH